MIRLSSLARPVALIALGICLGLSPAAAEPSAKDVLKTYADIAQAGYADSLATAKTLQLAVDQLPRQADRARICSPPAPPGSPRASPTCRPRPIRFGNSIVDDWEGRVNSWPLDEGLIDYVAASYGTDSPENELYVANVIANASLTIGGKKIDTAKITKELLAEKLQEAGGVEANVATGYHAVEFLLWGQDLNGTGPGNGNRPATDYDTKNCTDGNCDRRAAISPRRHRSAGRRPRLDGGAMGAGRRGAQDRSMDGTDEAGLTAIMTGLGSLSYGELAGERMKLGLMIHDPEEEHDCFSDNTHASHYLRRARHPQRLSRPLPPRRRLAWCRARACPIWSRRSRRRSMPRCGPSSTPPWTP